jgi:hypothetical protein
MPPKRKPTIEELIAEYHRDEQTMPIGPFQDKWGKFHPWFILDTPPPLMDFSTDWTDGLHRSYMHLTGNRLAVRLPVAKRGELAVDFPYQGETLILNECGSGFYCMCHIAEVDVRSRRVVGIITTTDEVKKQATLKELLAQSNGPPLFFNFQ